MIIPSLSDHALQRMQAPDDPASPEEVFLAWLLSLPDSVEAPEAAAAEVVRLDRVRLQTPRGRRLRELFVAAAECAAPKGRMN